MPMVYSTFERIKEASLKIWKNHMALTPGLPRVVEDNCADEPLLDSSAMLSPRYRLGRLGSAPATTLLGQTDNLY
jgi:hypothetical protein